MGEDLAGDRRSLETQLEKVSFLIGVEEGRWKVCAYEFPHLVVEARAQTASGTKCAMHFRLECSGYPAIGPFVERWDIKTASRPAAPDVNAAPPSLVDAFKEWHEAGTIYGGIYRPWQRGAAPHNNWARQRPDLAWHPARPLTFIMEQLCGLVLEQAFWLDYRAAA
jgi:hypothetical protein